MRKDHNTSIMNNMSTNGEVRLYANSGYRITADPISANTWNHVALQRASNVTKMYLNGKEQSTTYSDTNNYTGDKIYLGSERDTTTELTGYISNFRQVIGSNAYTASSPSDYYGSFTGGPVYDITSASITGTAAGTALSLGTGAWTVEAWIYTSSTSWSLIDFGLVNGTHDQFVTDSGNSYFGHNDGSAWNSLNWWSSSDNGKWNHIAYVSESSTVKKIYKNGVLRETITTGASSHYGYDSADITIGERTDGYYRDTGMKLSNLRIVKGTAVYTGAFTPPTSPLTAISGTALLAFQQHTGSPADRSGNNVSLVADHAGTASTDSPFGPTITVPASPLTAVTNTKLLTAQRPIANAITNGSTMFPGEGTQITTSTSSDFTLGTGDFTVEGWFNFAHLPGSAGSGNYMMDFGGNGLVLQFQGASALGFWTSGDGYINGSVSLSTGTWYHMAWVRISGTGTFYLDGVQIASGSLAKDVTTNAMTMNGYHTGYSYGQQDVKYSDLRVVKGLGVYTGAFSRPTGPLTKTGGTYPNNTNRTDPSASQTVLLTHQQSTPAVGVPTDNSDSGHTLTAVGFGSQAVKGAGYVQVASDQSSSGYAIATNGNTKNARNWPFNYNG